jgi:hypothetical protein
MEDSPTGIQKIDEAMHTGKKNGTHSTKSGLYRLLFSLGKTQTEFYIL